MPGVCIQCALEAFVNDESPSNALYTDTDEEHIRVRHRGGVGIAERRDWERRAAEKMNREQQEDRD